MPNVFHTNFVITQDYGPSALSQEPAYDGYPHFHRGIDMVGNGGFGCPIYADAPGVVYAAGKDPSGNYVIVLGDDGYYRAFWHLNTWNVAAGQRVNNNT